MSNFFLCHFIKVILSLHSANHERRVNTVVVNMCTLSLLNPTAKQNTLFPDATFISHRVFKNPTVS